MNLKPGEFELQIFDNRRSTRKTFVGGRHFRIALQKIPITHVKCFTSRMEDLLRIASSVYFTDRLFTRDRKHGPEKWSRNIACSIEVLDPEFWTMSSVCDLLEETVEFVSGDRWRLDFHRAVGPDRFNCERQIPLDFGDSNESCRVCLYSGGLDSAAGLARRMQDDPVSITYAVNVQHRTDLGGTVTEQLDVLSKLNHGCISPVIVPFEMDAPKSLVRREETSQRTRSFLFIATGGVVAEMRSPELEVFESGLGAINVPLLASMEGSQATRSAHPKFLVLMSQLLSCVMESFLVVTLPFMSLTKGDLVKSLMSEPLRQIVPSTISCSHFPVRFEKGVSWRSCGLCPACIFRRVALNSAGIDELPSVYQHDILETRSSELGPKRLQYLLAYLLQVDHLADLDDDKLPLLVTRHLRMTNLLQPGESPQSYLDLFRRYRSEWRSLLEKARRNGCAWAHRINLPGQAV